MTRLEDPKIGARHKAIITTKDAYEEDNKEDDYPNKSTNDEPHNLLKPPSNPHSNTPPPATTRGRGITQSWKEIEMEMETNRAGKKLIDYN